MMDNIGSATLDALESLARSAAPGRWRSDDLNVYADEPSQRGDGLILQASLRRKYVDASGRDTNVAFVAVANPEMVLHIVGAFRGLLQHARELQERNEVLQHIVSEYEKARVTAREILVKVSNERDGLDQQRYTLDARSRRAVEAIAKTHCDATGNPNPDMPAIAEEVAQILMGLRDPEATT